MTNPQTNPSSLSIRKLLLLCLHWGVILHFLIEICYAGYMVFVILKPDSGGGPLMHRALEIPFELMVTRRLYALECWVATAGLAVYLAITEVHPRLKKMREE